MPILSIDGQHYESEHIADPYAELDMLLTMLAELPAKLRQELRSQSDREPRYTS